LIRDLRRPGKPGIQVGLKMALRVNLRPGAFANWGRGDKHLS